MILVLYALKVLGGTRSKQEVLSFIHEKKLYDVQPDDRLSYESKREWKCDTLLAWGRKHAIEHPKEELIFREDLRDAWAITRGGLRFLDEIFAKFRSGSARVQECFIWRPEFKQTVDSTYMPSKDDWKRNGNRTKQQRVVRRLTDPD